MNNTKKSQVLWVKKKRERYTTEFFPHQLLLGEKEECLLLFSKVVLSGIGLLRKKMTEVETQGSSAA